ncbi:MAG: peptide ABC transporter permease [Candidatus Hinthialibacteria bacterium]|nr:MAG: Glutathione transport system permease protein GsiD [Candidatus Hinthialibacteria bacterium OLB16]MBE7486860.1 ABC transporter permease [bacterium]MBV6480335.1 Glutathione transport system permease protein GsiD [bacterium]MCC6734312.1 ABC transporter permease [Candidatus Omnitrophota bacterium]MCE7906748.1 ABC transporter permease [Candidatus Omnitrophica bacterium COP1]
MKNTVYFQVFRTNPFAGIGFVFVVLLILIAIFAPWLAPQDPLAQSLADRDLPPGGEHWMGTDRLGRDIFSRVLYGARVSLSVGIIAQGVSVSLGLLLGLAAGYLRGWTDHLIMWLVNVVWAFPYLLLVLAIQFALGNRPENIFLAIGLTGWVGVARVVRGEVLSLREREFVDAARCLGLSPWRIMLRHILPNVLPTLVVVTTLGLATAIIAEAALSFLGLGIQPPNPSWGNMILDGYTRIQFAWWQAVFPSAAIVFSVLSFNLLGDALASPPTEL